MAKYVDYLVITCAGGEKTKKLISKSVISSMKKSSYLINVSRGTVIDEKAFDRLMGIMKEMQSH